MLFKFLFPARREEKFLEVQNRKYRIYKTDNNAKYIIAYSQKKQKQYPLWIGERVAGDYRKSKKGNYFAVRINPKTKAIYHKVIY